MIWYFLNTRWQKKSIKSEEKCKRSKLSWSWSAVTGYYWRPIVLGSCFSKSGGGASPAFFYFCPCLKTMTNLTLNGRSIDGVIGIRTWDRRMAGEDESSKLWRAPLSGPCVAENYSNLVNTLHSIIWVVSFHSSAK